jgi:hypothetical protein
MHFFIPPVGSDVAAHYFSHRGVCHWCKNVIRLLTGQWGAIISVPQQTYLSSSGQRRRQSELHQVEYNRVVRQFHAVAQEWWACRTCAQNKTNKPRYLSCISTFVSNWSEEADNYNGVSTSRPHTKGPTEGPAAQRNYSNKRNVCKAHKRLPVIKTFLPFWQAEQYCVFGT